MKLSSHYNKASIIITISILFTGAVIYYFVINYIAKDQLDQDLTEEVDEVVDYVNLNKQLPKQVDFDDDQTTFTKIGKEDVPRRFFDTVYYNAKEKESEAGRAVETIIRCNGENYKVVISESKEATEYLIQLILIITILLTIILSVALIVTNRLILNDLWTPFYKLLNQLKSFDITNSSELTFKKTEVDEFKELNSAVISLSSKAKNDYQTLKSFTENASHEMMTPLAVVISKLDTLIQDETLNAAQLAHITDIYNSISKLSRLNQSLLLLVKIENNQIADESLINFKDLIIEKVQQFQELIQGNNLRIVYKLDELHITASKYLVDIMLNNLISNAIRHNLNNGEIDVTLYNGQLIIKNHGEKTPLAEDLIFERFKKGKVSEGTGLGLTIVKNICTYYQYRLDYTFVTPWHIFTVNFNK